MILIADSGSTKTHWCLLDKKTVVKEIFSTGINPFYQSEEEITAEIKKQVHDPLGDTAITAVYFYGAGCVPEKRRIVADAIRLSYPHTTVEVNTDLLAAARALFANGQGIACILGTGSNSCFYDGKAIVKNVSPLGFILGDEGSGAVLGKKFIANLLKNQLPQDLSESFFSQHHTTPAEIMEAVYKQPFPNRYLAQFTHFMCENQHSPLINDIVYESFSEFFVRNIHQYDYREHVVSCMGSVAFCFEQALRQAATDHQITIGTVIRQPMPELIRFHG